MSSFCVIGNSSSGDEYVRLYQRYGQPVTEKCIIYADELFEMVLDYGDEV